MKYQVNWDYVSSIGGPWNEGDVIDGDGLDVEQINRDSPGVLTPLERDQPARQNRMAKRKATRDDRGAQEPITKAEFKAVKDG